MPVLHNTHHLQAALCARTPRSLETLEVPFVAHTHGPAPCRATTIGPSYETARLFAPFPFPHTKPQI